LYCGVFIPRLPSEKQIQASSKGQTCRWPQLPIVNIGTVTFDRPAFLTRVNRSLGLVCRKAFGSVCIASFEFIVHHTTLDVVQNPITRGLINKLIFGCLMLVGEITSEMATCARSRKSMQMTARRMRFPIS
jgi:hypothetical protein